MAARFEALDDLFDNSLELPIQGKTYTIPSPSGEDGLRIQRIATVAVQAVMGGAPPDVEALDDGQELDLFRMCLGAVYDELLEDGIEWSWIRHAGLTAMFWITSGVDDALTYWKAAGDPSRLAPNREARRQQSKRTGSAAGDKTQRRGSSSTTSGRKGGGRSRKASRG